MLVIADRFYLSLNTECKFVLAAYTKLQVACHAQAIIHASDSAPG